MGDAVILWITGAPGAGKTTQARKLERELAEQGMRPVVLDGDEVRTWLTPDCSFIAEDRLKHARRVFEVAKRIKQAGGVAICALVACPPERPDVLYYVTGRARPLWPGTTYTPPTDPDVTVQT